MPKQVKPLTDAKCRNAKAKMGKQAKYSDGGGLYLLVKPDGSKLWRFDYTRPSGKRNTLSFGKYPEVSLVDARTERDTVRSQLAKNFDPAVVRKLSREDSFEAIAREWLKLRITWAESHMVKQVGRLEKNIFPWLGNRPITEITPQELLTVLRRIEARGVPETAHRCRSLCSQIFRYAISTGRDVRDVAADLRGSLQEVVGGRYAAVTDTTKLPALLRDIDNYSGHFVVKAALRLAPLVFQRPGELRGARWDEIDLDSATWSIPVERMKLRTTMKAKRAGEKHIVPLSKQAIDILREIYPLTGEGTLVFPSVRIAPDSTGKHARPISDATLNVALRNMGYGKDVMTSHGWRAVARTLLDEVLGHKKDAIERQLAHAVEGPLGDAYNRAEHLKERREMMQRWADYLDGLKQSKAKVIPLIKKETV